MSHPGDASPLHHPHPNHLNNNTNNPNLNGGMEGGANGGGFTLPAALLAQYPALQGLQWDNLPQGEDMDDGSGVSGRSSFDAGSEGGWGVDDDDGYMSGPGMGNSGGWAHGQGAPAGGGGGGLVTIKENEKKGRETQRKEKLEREGALCQWGYRGSNFKGQGWGGCL